MHRPLEQVCGSGHEGPLNPGVPVRHADSRRNRTSFASPPTNGAWDRRTSIGFFAIVLFGPALNASMITSVSVPGGESSATSNGKGDSPAFGTISLSTSDVRPDLRRVMNLADPADDRGLRLYADLRASLLACGSPSAATAKPIRSSSAPCRRPMDRSTQTGCSARPCLTRGPNLMSRSLRF